MSEDKGLSIIQKEVDAWSDRNFPNSGAMDKLLGIVEEVGELAHAVLKQKQGIRGSYEELAEQEVDAIGDVMIYLLDYCSKRNLDLEHIVNKIWAQVSKRDWQSNPNSGQIAEE